MTGTTVWLASYPKSGNTWLRAIITALSVHPHLFGVNQLGSGAQPHSVASSLPRFGIDSRWLSQVENDRLRSALIADDVPGDGGGHVDSGSGVVPTPVVRKTHEVFRSGSPEHEPFPASATRAALLVVRDPRDVVCSYTPFFGTDLDGAIEAIGTVRSGTQGSPANCLTAQPWGSWSSHADSWLTGPTSFPVHHVRYEDLIADAVATLEPVFAAIGLECSHDQLAAAVEQTRFERLRQSEIERGFRETSPKTTTFFRVGRAGGWRNELSGAQIAAIEADHGEMMHRLGYEFDTDPVARLALAEARSSVRRRGTQEWTATPEHLGLVVSEGPVPDELAGAQRPRPWAQVTADAALVRLAGGSAVLVEGGERVTVHWERVADDETLDPSWLVQGWAVTLSWLQRGNLSLHAAAVRIGDEVVAVAGGRGAGKSTTAMGLRARGHQLLIDDVTLVELREDGAWATPYGRNVHLLHDSSVAIGVDFDALPGLAGGREKVAFRPEDPPTDPVLIDRIVVLTATESPKVQLLDVHGADRVPALRPHAARDGLAPAILGQQRFFTLLSGLAAAVPVQRLVRPVADWTLDLVLDQIEAGHATADHPAATGIR